MSLFSSQPRNRRSRHRSSRKPSREWVNDIPPSSASPAKKEAIPLKKGEVHQLHAQIGAIESFLARHHQAEVEKVQMKRENILPPPDRCSHRKARHKMTRAARRRYLAQRNRNGLRFLMLFCTACALVWWLLFPGN